MLMGRADLTLISVSAHCRVNQERTMGATKTEKKTNKAPDPGTGTVQGSPLSQFVSGFYA